MIFQEEQRHCLWQFGDSSHKTVAARYESLIQGLSSIDSSCLVLLGATLDVGTQLNSFGYGGTGKKSTARQFEDYGQTYGQVLPLQSRIYHKTIPHWSINI